jgi:hypothetical protein
LLPPFLYTELLKDVSNTEVMLFSEKCSSNFSVLFYVYAYIFGLCQVWS